MVHVVVWSAVSRGEEVADGDVIGLGTPFSFCPLVHCSALLRQCRLVLGFSTSSWS